MDEEGHVPQNAGAVERAGRVRFVLSRTYIYIILFEQCFDGVFVVIFVVHILILVEVEALIRLVELHERVAHELEALDKHLLQSEADFQRETHAVHSQGAVDYEWKLRRLLVGIVIVEPDLEQALVVGDDAIRVLRRQAEGIRRQVQSAVAVDCAPGNVKRDLDGALVPLVLAVDGEAVGVAAGFHFSGGQIWILEQRSRDLLRLCLLLLRGVEIVEI